VVRLELERRHRLLVAVAQGNGDATRVLDLGRADHRQVLRQAVDHGPADDQVGSFDAVVSVAGLARVADLGAAVDAVARLLAPEGVLLAVEPGFRPGPLALVASSLGALLPPARGVHLARDLPTTIRAAGLTVTDVERFTMPTMIWPLRPFVQLRAQDLGTAFGATR
jgi:SAM-dependent methyltransferase